MKDWYTFIEKLEPIFGKSNIQKWVRPLKIVSFDAKNLYLATDDSFQESWVREYLLPYAKDHLKNNNGHLIRIHLNQTKQTAIENPENTKDPIIYRSDYIFPWATFPKFIFSEDNAFTLKSLCKIFGLEEKTFDPILDFQPPLSLNPIFIYGGPETGKTHLLMAMAKLLYDRNKKILFIDADTFTEHVVKAIRSHEMDIFRRAYRTVDVLVIDNVEKLSKRTASQEELFHTFNALHIEEKILIFSSRHFPRILDGIEERLISRFEWGITLKLTKIFHPKDLIKMAEKRMAHFHLFLKKNAVEAVIKAGKSCAGIHAILETIHQNTENTQRFLDTSQILSFIQKFASSHGQKQLSPEMILTNVAQSFGIKKEDITAKSQRKEHVFPRKLAMYFIRRELGFSFMKIGALFSKDHSTVMSAISYVQKKLENADGDVSYYKQKIEKSLRSETSMHS